mmetsp:Transcript_9230/g.17643  ORF Transcript_9230/g.17643 Transcript_9230/m.17643 type:complete len:80 (+) Transcript_9230:119-358(+)
MKNNNVNLNRRLSDSSTTAQPADDKGAACRHIETIFSQEFLPESVYGNKFFLPAQIIYESRDSCAIHGNKQRESSEPHS